MYLWLIPFGALILLLAVMSIKRQIATRALWNEDRVRSYMKSERVLLLVTVVGAFLVTYFFSAQLDRRIVIPCLGLLVFVDGMVALRHGVYQTRAWGIVAGDNARHYATGELLLGGLCLAYPIINQFINLDPLVDVLKFLATKQHH